MTRKPGHEPQPPGRATGGETGARTANGTRKRIYLRVEIPAVLDQALEQYAAAVALGKAAAARTLLMRILVKRNVHVPEPANEPT